MHIVPSEVSQIDLRHLSKYATSPSFLIADAGYNHTNLLAYMSSKLQKGDKIADLGTYTGDSAISFAYNPDVLVTTYDIQDFVPEGGYKALPNVKFVCGDCAHYFTDYLDSKIILIDIAPHEGVAERNLINILRKYDYKGIVVLDDIYYSDAMKNFWEWINLKKIDATPYGHFSGTGIVVFDPQSFDVTVE